MTQVCLLCISFTTNPFRCILSKLPWLSYVVLCHGHGNCSLILTIPGDINPETKNYLRKKVEEYMNRAEIVKTIILHRKENGQFHEQVHIENNSTGHSYNTLFGRFLDEDTQYVIVEDPYIRNFHQVSYSSNMKLHVCLLGPY